MIDEKKLIEKFEEIQSSCETLMKRVWFDGVLAIIESQPKVGEWIPIEDRFPESRKSVLIYSKEGGVAEGEYDAQKGYFVQYRWNAKDIHVIAWQPLPAPFSSGD